jgi:hypothetical protein
MRWVLVAIGAAIILALAALTIGGIPANAEEARESHFALKLLGLLFLVTKFAVVLHAIRRERRVDARPAGSESVQR